MTLCGARGEQPPADEQGFVAFADSLGAPEISEIVHTLAPLGPPVRIRFPTSVRRHYQRLRELPEGVVVVADALCSLSPVYGQGMTVAALEALLLRRLLADGTERLGQRFFREAADLVDTPWTLAAVAESRLPGVAGRFPALAHLAGRYVNWVQAAATVDPALTGVFLRVLHLLDPPSRLLAPGTLRRVAAGAWGMRGHVAHRLSDSSTTRRSTERAADQARAANVNPAEQATARTPE